MNEFPKAEAGGAGGGAAAGADDRREVGAGRRAAGGRDGADHLDAGSASPVKSAVREAARMIVFDRRRGCDPVSTQRWIRIGFRGVSLLAAYREASAIEGQAHR